MECRKNFILDVHYGLIDVKDLGWVEIEDRYNYQAERKLRGVKKGDQCRKHYNWYIKKGKDKGEWAPKERIELADGANLTLRSRWQAQTKGGEIKWLESYRNEATKQEMEEFKRQLMRDVAGFSPQIPAWEYETYVNPLVYVISLPDLHFGKQSLEKTKEEFDYCFNNLVNRVFDVERYILPIGNDLFNSEGMRSTTTRGTKQFDFIEWKKCFRHVWKFIAEKITYLSEVAPVYVPIVQGNHSWERTFYLGDVLYGYFHNNKNVIVDNSFEPRKYFDYGNTMMGWDHGDNIKPGDYPLLMAVEKPQVFARCENRIMFTGHLHSQQGYEIKGVQVKFLPSICPSDEWHKQHGYVSRKAAQGYKYDKDGLVGYEEVRI